MAGQQGEQASSERVENIVIESLTARNRVEAKTQKSVYVIDQIRNDGKGGVSGEITRVSHSPIMVETPRGLIMQNVPYSIELGRHALLGWCHIENQKAVKADEGDGIFFENRGLRLRKLQEGSNKADPGVGEMVTSDIKILMLGSKAVQGTDEDR